LAAAFVYVSHQHERRTASARFDLLCATLAPTGILINHFTPSRGRRTPHVTVGVARYVGQQVSNRPAREESWRTRLLVIQLDKTIFKLPLRHKNMFEIGPRHRRLAVHGFTLSVPVLLDLAADALEEGLTAGGLRVPHPQ
jgi:hypothetical protein